MKYKINKGFISQKIGKKTVIFDGERAILYSFNETGFKVFSLLKRGFTKKAIVDYFVKTYQIDKKRAGKDIDEVVNGLLASRIVSSSKQKK